MEKRARFDELDGYRGIAALVVVAYHVYLSDALNRQGQAYAGTLGQTLLTAGDGAVDWFFVLSGFVVSLPLVRALLTGTAAPSPLAFLARRARRILPLYYAAIVLAWWLWPQSPRSLLTHLTFTHIVDPLTVTDHIGAAWSLACEVIYYLLIALLGLPLTLLCQRIATPRARAHLLLTGLLLTWLASVAYASTLGPNVAGALAFSPFGRGGGFLMGVVLAVLWSWRGGWLGRRGRWSLGAAAGCLTLGAIVARPSPAGAVLFHPVIGLAFGALLASTLLAADRAAVAWWWHRPGWRWLAAISYSVYLLHQLIIWQLVRHGILSAPNTSAYVLNLALVLAVTLPLASLSYWVIERPWLRPRGHHRLTWPARYATGRGQDGGAPSGRPATAPGTSPRSARSSGY
ncbi:MAG TPA: acyltransferase [Thermomicrobiales bacterium]|nr:acyltransferase [Thermomicrobiales bacterium]